jgi:hypothetical protein
VATTTRRTTKSKAAADKPAAEAEIDPVDQIEALDDDPVETPKASRTGQNEVAVDDGVNEVTGPSHLGFQTQAPQTDLRQRNADRVTAVRTGAGDVSEIEAEPVGRSPIQIDPNGMTEIRMAREIEEFTYGDPKHSVHLEAGKRYRMPFHVAQYLDGLEAIHHRV